MTLLSPLLSSIHLLGLGLGFGAVLARGALLLSARSNPTMRGLALHADTAWGIAALMLLPAGLLRAFTTVEKGPSYYLHSGAFYVKMTLVVLLLLGEIWPMVTLIRWRIAERRGQAIGDGAAPIIAGISFAQAALVVGIVGCAALMARGWWMV